MSRVLLLSYWLILNAPAEDDKIWFYLNVMSLHNVHSFTNNWYVEFHQIFFDKDHESRWETYTPLEISGSNLLGCNSNGVCFPITVLPSFGRTSIFFNHRKNSMLAHKETRVSTALQSKKDWQRFANDLYSIKQIKSEKVFPTHQHFSSQHQIHYGRRKRWKIGIPLHLIKA